MTSYRIDTINAECKTDALRGLLRATLSQDPRLNPGWVPELPRLFAEAGLSGTESDVREMPAGLAYFSHECHLMIHESLVRQTKNKEVARVVGELMPEVTAETKRGAWLAFKRWTVIGRKV